MSVFTSLGIVILAMVIMGSLQLSPGVFALLYHYASGKYSKNKASHLAFFFILGVEVLAACVFLFAHYIVYILFIGQSNPLDSILYWAIAGILFALSAISLFFYYRRGPGSRLFISREHARSLDNYAKTASTPADAFSLGAFSTVCELLFTLPLYLITALELMRMSTEFFTSPLLTVIYIIVPTIPLFIIRLQFKRGHNLADFQRTRAKDKNFTRFVLCLCYLVLAVLIIQFRALS